MAEICCGVVNDGDSPVCETSSSRAARRRRMEIRRFKFVAGVAATTTESSISLDTAEAKRQKMESSNTTTCSSPLLSPRECDSALESCISECDHTSSTSSNSNSNSSCSSDHENDNHHNFKGKDVAVLQPDGVTTTKSIGISSCDALRSGFEDVVPKFGIASVCGRRRDMEDAVTAHPSFFRRDSSTSSELHYFAVYDGHGCSHVAMKCKERLHELVKEELVGEEAVPEWQVAMERSFGRMDKEVVACNEGVIGSCRCELQTPECDAVGSTAVVAVVTPDKIIVANCGDSRAVLCRNGKAVPLSSDHKPDRPDELNRIQEAGGRVIYWDGPRVLGVLAMSRAIGDNYLKPYVSCDPEVTITERTGDDDCLILASDGLWDVVSNDTACGVARMCLRGKVPPVTMAPEMDGIVGGEGEGMADKACSDASMLLTKLALARHSTDNVSVVVIDLRRDT